MKCKSLWQIIFIPVLLISTVVNAGTIVVEGSNAKPLFENKKPSAITLSQKNKIFFIKNLDGEHIENPQEITVKVGEYLFITNDEDRTVHNVYDLVDRSWVLKKQLPGGVAAVKFGEPKVHKLNCAIHPQMRVTVNVVE